MVPRYATGIWWSRWYNVDDWDVAQIVDQYRTRDLPLDVYVLDMDWHTKYGWGTYSFDTRLFPIPRATMDWLHNQVLLPHSPAFTKVTTFNKGIGVRHESS